MRVQETNLIESTLKRDRAIVIGALLTIIFLCWLYILNGAGVGMTASDMSSLSIALGKTQQLQINESVGPTIEGTMGMLATPAAWSLDYAIIMFFMWLIMMVAMMLPAATPMILLHAMVNRKAAVKDGGEYGPWQTTNFTLGYLLVWAVFSTVAVTLQWAFEMTGMLSPMMMNSANTFFTGSILILAGIYQMTPVKQACLKHCRTPIDFLSRHWRPGTKGALIMGVHHGAYCLGCCWSLMFILFFGGVMNLYWIVGLAFIVLIEKMTPFGRQLSWGISALLLVWGVSFIYRTIL